MKLNRQLAAAAFMSLMVTLSSCGQNPTAGLPASAAQTGTAQTETAQAAPLSASAQENQARTSSVAAARGLTVKSVVTLESDSGVPTTYIEVTDKEGQDAVLIGSVENGAPVFAELRTVPMGQQGTGGSLFSMTALTAQGTVNTGMSAQGVSDWVFNRLVDLVNQYKKAPRWLKWTLRGPLKAVIKLIIGEAINWGCNKAYDTLVKKLHASNRWVPLGKTLLCEIILG